MKGQGTLKKTSYLRRDKDTGEISDCGGTGSDGTLGHLLQTKNSFRHFEVVSQRPGSPGVSEHGPMTGAADVISSIFTVEGSLKKACTPN